MDLWCIVLHMKPIIVGSITSGAGIISLHKHYSVRDQCSGDKIKACQIPATIHFILFQNSEEKG